MRGRKKYDYTTQEIHVKHDGINLYGKALVPKSEPQAKCPTVIYAHGAESDYKADYTTLSHRRLCSNSVLPCKERNCLLYVRFLRLDVAQYGAERHEMV